MAKRKPKSHVLTDVVWAGDIVTAENLVADGHSIDERDRFGKTPLMIATMNDSAKVAKRFLTLGANPNCVDDQRRSALHLAAEEHSVPLARLLIKAGAKVDLRDAAGNTPLWNALYFSIGRDCELQFVSLLLRHGADPDRKNKKKVSPLDLQDDSDHFAKLKKCLTDAKAKASRSREVLFRSRKTK